MSLTLNHLFIHPTFIDHIHCANYCAWNQQHKDELGYGLWPQEIRSQKGEIPYLAGRL